MNRRTKFFGRHLTRGALRAALGIVVSFQAVTAVAATNYYEWTFTGGNLSPALGTGVLAFADSTTSNATTFGTTGGGVPHIRGQPASFMHVPVFNAKSNGYFLHLSQTTSNGGGIYINQYTLIMDVLVPAPINWAALFNTDPFNNNDADWYVAPDGGLGILDLGYTAAGTIASNTWYRMAFAADLGDGVVTYYLNGAQVFQRTGGSLIDGRYSLYSTNDNLPAFLLFNEGDTSGNYTHELYVAGIAVADRTLTASEVAALAGPFADGIFIHTSSPPALVSASSRGNPNSVTLTFSEPLDSASALAATNYAIDRNIVVTGVVFGATSSIVRLQTSTLLDGTNYTVTISNVFDLQGEAISPNPTLAAFTHGAEFLKFRVLHRRYNGPVVSGYEISRLITNSAFPNSPSSISSRTNFEIAPNVDNYYGSQLIGFYVAPTNGFYKFWMCSDGQGLTYLSTDANPAHKVLIAAEPDWNNSRDYTTTARRNAANPENRTNLVQLAAGQRVYLEAIMMTALGAENLSVAVQLPGVVAAPTVPIDGTNFVEMRYFSNRIFQTVGPLAIATQPENPLAVQETKQGVFSVVLDGTPPWSIQWYSNNVLIPGATNLTYMTTPMRTNDVGTIYHVTASNEFSSVVSAPGILARAPTRPSLVSASSRGDPNGVTLVFSEPMDPGSALFTANYQINRGVAVLGASFGPSTSIVRLRTSRLLEGTNYTITISQVQDAQFDGPISPNPTNATFTHGAEFLSFRILHRRYLPILGPAGGNDLGRLTNSASFPNASSTSTFPSLFEIPLNFNDNYGSQLLGFYVAPSNGLYRFWMCSDDRGVTYLSTDGNPAHKQLIASEPIWSASRDYTSTTRRDPYVPENRSAFISLNAGQRVYLEALAVEANGDDNLSVAVQLPGEVVAPTVPIASTNFAVTRFYSNTFFQTIGPVAILSDPESSLTMKLQQRATFSVVLDGTPPWSIQWFSNNVPISGATNLTYTTPPATLGDSGTGYHVTASNEFSGAVSAQGVIYVTSDPLPSLVAWWPGEGNPIDVAGGHPTTSLNPSYTNGFAGQAFNFNGSNSYLDAGTTPDFTPPNFSISFWMNARAASSVPLSHWGITTPNPNAWQFELLADRRVQFSVESYSMGAHSVATTAIPLNEWHHMTGTFDGATVRAYLDGQLAGQLAFVGVLQTNYLGITSIGVRKDYPGNAINGYFNGALDEVQFFKRVLSAAEIQSSFNAAAAGRFPSDLAVSITATPDPVIVTSNLTYVITMANLGPQAVDSVVLSNFLPANVDFISAVSSVGSCSLANGVLTCGFGTLSNQMTAAVTVQVMPTASALLYTRATVMGAVADPFPANNNAVAHPRAVREPIITMQPTGVSVMTNDTITLTGIAFGAPPLRYQWRLNGVNIPGETNDTITILAAQAVNAGSYTLVAHNPFGAVNSLVAGATVQITALSGADAFSNRVSLAGASGLIRGTTAGATRETGEPMHAGKTGGKSVWYSWVAPANGIATVHLLGSSFDTLLGVYTGNDVASLAEAGSDEDRGDFLTSKVLFNATAGTSYAIALDGFAGSSGEYVMSWSLETTTDTLPVITLHPQSQVIAEGGTVTFSAGAAGSDLRYQWFLNNSTIAGATNISLTLTNLQITDVGYYTLGVFNAVGRMVTTRAATLELGDPSAVLSQGKFEDLPDDGGGNLVASGKHPVIHLSVSSGSVLSHTFSTVGGTTQLRETNHCGVLGGSSVWLSLIASNEGIVQLDTIGSTFDTVLAAYEGANLLALTCLACDNDGAPDHIRSLIRFPVQSNHTYRVVVDGVGGTQGVARVNGRLGTRPLVTSPVRIPVTGIGQPLVLSASVSNVTSDLMFFWRFNNSFIFGANDSFYAISNLTLANAGTYSVVLSNFTGLHTNLAAVVSASGYDGQRVNGVWQFRVIGYGAQPLLFETTSNLMNWVPWRTNPQPGPFDYPDPEASNQVRRFYRITPR